MTGDIKPDIDGRIEQLLREHDPVTTDRAEFLGARPPFDALSPEELDRVASAAEVEFVAAGATLVEQGGAPVEHLWLVRSGALDVVHPRQGADERAKTGQCAGLHDIVSHEVIEGAVGRESQREVVPERLP